MAEFKRNSGEHASGWVATNDPAEIAKYRRLVEDGTGWQEVAEQEPAEAEEDGGEESPAPPAKAAAKPSRTASGKPTPTE